MHGEKSLERRIPYQYISDTSRWGNKIAQAIKQHVLCATHHQMVFGFPLCLVLRANPCTPYSLTPDLPGSARSSPSTAHSSLLANGSRRRSQLSLTSPSLLQNPNPNPNPNRLRNLLQKHRATLRIQLTHSRPEIKMSSNNRRTRTLSWPTRLLLLLWTCNPTAPPWMSMLPHHINTSTYKSPMACWPRLMTSPTRPRVPTSLRYACLPPPAHHALLPPLRAHRCVPPSPRQPERHAHKHTLPSPLWPPLHTTRTTTNRSPELLPRQPPADHQTCLFLPLSATKRTIILTRRTMRRAFPLLHPRARTVPPLVAAVAAAAVLGAPTQVPAPAVP
ncbi:hypothetical protein BCR44DRAFT_351558 [Catenaria anguillulae PL171]|uniref:Uncharacterized protein n=1 Tax=Catenaria anguillulae PL171 TaxID=765915 RepID=A0A1Y2H8F0_9FUNG|nr:hypothetical protein BCR44DRAFT_351558 [Catenaria anguillulae PL171]